MATVAVLQTDLLLNSAAFRTGMVAAAQTATTTLGQIQAEAKKTAASIDLMSKAAGAFIGFEAVKEGVGALIEAQIQMQQIHFTLVSATGSANGAADAFDFLKQKSQELGLNLQPAAQAFGQLAAAASASGIPMEQAEKLFTSFGEASTTLHLSSEQSQHALLALTEMMSRGTIQARQLNQQLGFAIPGSAGRFKAAVMEAIKGTDLAGQSFEQLEKKGELVTARFMPQLIQALAESGRGYQEAAQGLNAQINRLKTSWFDLKNDMSSGLFNDAATSGIALVAQNMERIATAASIVGGLAVARLLGGQVDKGISGISSAVQRRQELAQQAAAAVQLTDAEVAETAAQVRNNEAALVGVTTARSQAFAARQAATAMYEQALAQNAAAQATLAHQRTAATLSANIRAQAVATAQAEAAQLALNKAQVQYDASIVASNALKEQQIAIDGRLLQLRAANTAAIEAQTVANEAQAATSVGATLGRGLASAGSSLLALVGGPWGLAIAAVGALGYAIYDLKAKADEWKKGTEQQVTSLGDLRTQVKAATEDFQKLHSSMTLGGAVKLFTDSSEDLAKKRAELADLQAQYKSLMAELTDSGGIGAGATAGMQLKQVADRIEALQQQIPPTSDAVNALGTQISGSLVPAVDAAKGAFDRLRAGGSLSGIFSGLADDVDKGIKQVDDAKKKVDDLLGRLQQQGGQWAEQAATKGMSHAKLAQYELSQAIANIKSQRLPAATESSQIEQAKQEAQASIIAGAALDATKTHVDKVGNAYNSLAKSIHEKITAQREELDSGSKLTAADKLLLTVKEDLLTNLKKLSPLKKQQLLDDAQSLVTLTNETAAQKQKNDELQRESVLRQQISDMQANNAQKNSREVEGIGHGTQWSTQQKGIEQLTDEYKRAIDAQDKLFKEGHIGADENAAAVAALTLAEQQDIAAKKKMYEEEKVAQANWKNGASAAFENFRDSAANVAGATESVFTNAFNGMTDALTTFATTGKLNFKGLVSSILTDLARMELRIVESKILTSILGMFAGGAGGGGFSNSDALAGSSIGGGGFNFAAVSGGRASGGPVSAGSLYQVNEKGPELLTTGGATYLMMGGQDGHVTPNGGARGGGSSGGSTITNQITVVVQSNGQSTSKTNTSGDDKSAMGRQIGDLVKGTVVETVTRMTQPGGLLWQQRVGQVA